MSELVAFAAVSIVAVLCSFIWGGHLIVLVAFSAPLWVITAKLNGYKFFAAFAVYLFVAALVTGSYIMSTASDVMSRIGNTEYYEGAFNAPFGNVLIAFVVTIFCTYVVINSLSGGNLAYRLNALRGKYMPA